jgi:hypothetical protein
MLEPQFSYAHMSGAIINSTSEGAFNSYRDSPW